ncbi:TonB-dependent receptor [Mucilaginibacter sp. UR6-11]|uniref:TonB-dependent receptor n=1 Tax=Mucilaginibacter sp. UR6-11 TaxID=1435644 RepID=UPI001E2D65C9|nr:TonB-dependent receptor [Mucilaginibacter sp. UR6-11]MCC8424577.1 TonB-dependent receptor [Mucilaginibacter sp. UR6-11]
MRVNIIVLLLTLSFLEISAKSYSQTISLSGKNVTLEKAFAGIEQQSGYFFFYKYNDLKDAKPVTFELKNETLTGALKKLFSGQPYTYTISPGNKSIVVNKAPSAVPMVQPAAAVILQGTVIDEKGLPLPGVTVKLKGAAIIVSTDKDGKFSIKIPEATGTLVFTSVGYAPFEYEITGTTPINIRMKEQVSDLQQVVVIGYGSVKKSDLTGAVSVIKMKDLENIPVVRVDQMLQGRIAGAEVVSTTGEPGAGTSIRIRGTRSISATNEPLFVVDGVLDAINSLNDINPSDIASIQVLKDASSTAIYGSRGSNGVIVITTKMGVSGKNTFTYHADIGASQLPRFLDLMNAEEFANLQNDRFYFTSGANQSKPLEEYPYPNPVALGEGTNWTKEITHSAPYQNHTFSASGGDKTSSYYFSGNYNNTEGIVINSGLKRYQARFNFDKTVSKYVKAGLRLNYAYLDQNVNKADIGSSTLWYKSTMFLAPTIGAYKPNGTLNDFNTQWYTGTLFDSPLANVLMQQKYQERKTLSSNLFLEISPVKGLKIRSAVSFYDFNRFDDTFYPSTLPTRMSKNSGAYAAKASYKDNNILNENTVNYNKTWGKNNIDLLYGITFQSFWTSNQTVSGDGYFIDDIGDNDLGAVPSKETLNVGSGLSNQKKVSNLARVNYNYDSKYFLTVTGRADASSNFAADHKWGYFPSAAFKWNILKEDFMKRHADKFDELAIRLSAGISGNDAISRYQSLSQLNSSSNGYIFSGVTPASYYPVRIANDGLTWEKTTSYDAGLDFSILNNRLNITFDAYSSKTSDLLLTVQLPTQVGYSSRLTNIGKTSNKGVELAIDTKNISNKNFSWSSTFTIAHNSQMVDDIGGLDRIIAYANPFGAQYMMYGYEKGRPLNAVWGMQYAGVWKTQAEITQNLTDKKYASSAVNFYSPGRQRYIDQNHDGVLDNKDLIYLGNSDPDFYGGIQNSFRIYRFTLGVYLSYSVGGKIYNPTELFMGTGTYLSNQYKYMVNAWNPIRNPNSDYPRADSKDDIPNDRFLHSASFLRLKNVSLGYNFNLAKATKNAVQSLSLTATGNNLYLLKYYNGYDPEVSTASDGSTIRRMDNGAYPASRTITFSAEIKF